MSKLKVLVVDDAKFIRDRITAMEREAFPDSRVYTCENGKDAIRAMQATQYQILLCDWEMPVMSCCTAFHITFNKNLMIFFAVAVWGKAF
jgi:CheY-like chemotaxis protein